MWSRGSLLATGRSKHLLALCPEGHWLRRRALRHVRGPAAHCCVLRHRVGHRPRHRTIRHPRRRRTAHSTHALALVVSCEGLEKWILSVLLLTHAVVDEISKSHSQALRHAGRGTHLPHLRLLGRLKHLVVLALIAALRGRAEHVSVSVRAHHHSWHHAACTPGCCCGGF